MSSLSRRAWLRLSALGASAVAAGATAVRGPAAQGDAAAMTHGMGPMGRVAPGGFNPSTFLRAWNFSDVPPAERSGLYRETRRPDGSRLREYQIHAIEHELEVAPGVFFQSWAYNGQVPGPTLRATEGDRLRVTFTNHGTHPHSMHFHGWHPPEMDGSLPEHAVMPGQHFVYEFDAAPFGVHLYHCHTTPLKRHLHKGLYGVFIVDPREARPPADEIVMVLNAFDTDFDARNDVYAVNTVAHHFMHEPIAVDVSRLLRMFVVNVTEFDPINSLHLHGMFFDVYRTGTRGTPDEHTDTVMLCQGQRAIVETRFRYPGRFMFHAHQSEFAELGWMGLFEATDNRRDT